MLETEWAVNEDETSGSSVALWGVPFTAIDNWDARSAACRVNDVTKAQSSQY